MKRCKHENILGRVGKKEDEWYKGGVTMLANGLVSFDSYECQSCGKTMVPKNWKIKRAIKAKRGVR